MLDELEDMSNDEDTSEIDEDTSEIDESDESTSEIDESDESDLDDMDKIRLLKSERKIIII